MRLWRASIWHPDAIPVYEGETSAELKRYVLPLLDAVLIIMGIMALYTGMPSFDIVYNSLISWFSALLLLVAAAMAGVGLIFPRLWKMESIGKIIMCSILSGYATALWCLVVAGQDSRGFMAGAMTGLVVVLGWNLWRIGRERRARKAQAESKK